MRIVLRILCLTLLSAGSSAQAAGSVTDASTLGQAEASRFAKLALKCLRKEYPNKIDHVMTNEADVQSPQSLHPAFFGCYDWHSSVHAHWLLVRLLRLFPQLPEAMEIRTGLSQNLTSENILTEANYFKSSSRKSFERTYGWAWLLKLAEELYLWNDPDARRLYRDLRPLVDVILGKYAEFLPKQTYPIRTGVHPNTAFGLAFALDYATTVDNEELKNLIEKRSRAYFAADMAYPANWEPGGEDFLSPSLIEADLMRRVMKPVEFRRWFHRFLPGIATGKFKTLLIPAVVTDRSDPKLVHLDGLNLSRAWCMRSIASALPTNDRARRVLANAAEMHARDSLKHVTSGDYSGEHWLASFAVYMLSTPAAEVANL